MDRDHLLKHLRAWADGVDPATGAALPPHHPAQQPELLRVVFATLALIESCRASPGASAGPAGLRLAARNAGRPWSGEDDLALAVAFDAGQKVVALATRFERTRGSISARLVRLGKIEAPPGLRLRGIAAPTDVASVTPLPGPGADPPMPR